MATVTIRDNAPRWAAYAPDGRKLCRGHVPLRATNRERVVRGQAMKLLKHGIRDRNVRSQKPFSERNDFRSPQERIYILEVPDAWTTEEHFARATACRRERARQEGLSHLASQIEKMEALLARNPRWRTPENLAHIERLRSMLERGEYDTSHIR